MAPVAVVEGERKGRTEISLLSAGCVSDATISVMVLFAPRTFRYLSERFGIDLKSNLKAVVSSLDAGCAFFWVGLPCVSAWSTRRSQSQSIQPD